MSPAADKSLKASCFFVYVTKGCPAILPLSTASKVRVKKEDVAEEPGSNVYAHPSTAL
jgi:hypothetical protein